MSDTQVLTPILPCNDLKASHAFYLRMGFTTYHEEGGYIILGHPSGAALHLNQAVEGWLIPGRNPFGMYLYIENVDELAAEFKAEWLEPHGPEAKPWGMYEFSLSDPDETLVRIGWPTRLRPAKP